MRSEMSATAADAYVRIAHEHGIARVGVAERRFAAPARWFAIGAGSSVALTVVATVAVAYAPIAEPLFKAIICTAIMGGGGTSSVLMFRKLIEKLISSAE